MLLPENLARRYRALPIRFLDDGYVLVAVADPTNVMFSDELRLALGMPVRVCVASPDAIELAITKLNDGASIAIEDVVTDAQETEDDATVLDLNHDTPAVVFINRAISKALDLGASDIHFTPQQRRLFVRVRVDGVMRELTSIAGTQGSCRREPAQDHGRARHRRAARPAGRPRLDQARRASRSTCGSRSCRRPTARRSPCASSRRAKHRTRSTRWACGPRSRAALERAISQPFGAVVVVGPTGSGKTTTLYTCLQMLNTPGSPADDDRGSGRVPRRRPRSDRGQPEGRAHVRERPPHGAPLRSRRAPRRRDPRRGNGPDRVPRGDDRPPRADDAPRPDGGVGDPAADRHADRAQHPRDLDQLHRRTAARPPRLPGVLRADDARSRQLLAVLSACREGYGELDSLPGRRLPRVRRHRVPRVACRCSRC